MKLKSLAERLNYTLIQGSADKECGKLIYDSRLAEEGSVFVAVVGSAADGHTFLGGVLEKGASACVIDDAHAKDPGILAILENYPETAVISVPDTRYALAILSAAYFGYPAESLPVIGVTGTKGKTTTTYMIKSILENAGKKVGLIGTIEADTCGAHYKADNTTPESYLIQKYFREMLDHGCDMAVMEVSSQALMMDRTAGIEFAIGIFTNIEPDHIGPNEHASFEEYLECKGRLFRQCRIGIINADDPHAEDILRGHTCEVETFSAKKEADYRASEIEHIYRPGYLGVAYQLSGKASFRVELDIPGLFTVYNSLTAIAAAEHFGVSEEDIRKALRLAKVKGRVEIIDISDDFTLMIDYAHNAMALRSLLLTLKDYDPKRLVTVFGCGGNRARSRRFEMGEVSGNLSDLTIITSDNPRFEEPADIIADIRTGIEKTDGKYIEIPDRKEAIAYAIHHAEKGDVIILAGKGHEDYQEICGKKYPMDERVLIREILEEDGL